MDIIRAVDALVIGGEGLDVVGEYELAVRRELLALERLSSICLIYTLAFKSSNTTNKVPYISILTVSLFLALARICSALLLSWAVVYFCPLSRGFIPEDKAGGPSARDESST